MNFSFSGHLVETWALDCEINLQENARENACANTCEIALVDAVVMAPGIIGSRAIWETDGIREIVLTRAEASAVGMSALGGMLASVAPADDVGLHLVLGKDRVGDGAGAIKVNAAIAQAMAARWYRPWRCRAHG